MKGVYILAILVNRSLNVRTRAQKNFFLENGFYAYIGSAQKGFEKRLMRHFKRVREKSFWHIDYLLAMDGVSVVKAFYKEATKPEECRTAQSLSTVAHPINGFGCSDCKCGSHLFHFDCLSDLESVCLKLGFKPFASSCQ